MSSLVDSLQKALAKCCSPDHDVKLVSVVEGIEIKHGDHKKRITHAVLEQCANEGLFFNEISKWIQLVHDYDTDEYER